MSIRALLKGVEKRLRSADVLNDQPAEDFGKLVGIHEGGRPPGFTGQTYYALHWNGGRGTDRNPQRHDVMHGVVVTLTCRLNYAPRDRQGARLTTIGDVYDLVDAVAGPNIVHGNWDTVRYANEFITGTADWAALDDTRTVTANGFVEPLVLADLGPERTAPPGWVAESAAKDVYVIDIKFELARRVQANY